MLHLIKVYGITLFVFLILDYLWLGRIAAGFYKEQLGTLARWSGDSLTPDIPSAVVVYLLIPLGIVLFALPHVSDEQLVGSALLCAAIVGTCACRSELVVRLSKIPGIRQSPLSACPAPRRLPVRAL